MYIIRKKYIFAMLKYNKFMKTNAQSHRRGVSHTPQSNTPHSHTPQPHKFHRRSIRLKGHDYSDDGFYFITICTKDRHCYFGRVIDGKMVLNEKGQIVKNEWLNTANVRQGDVILHEYVVMPNHFHAIVEICRGGVRDSTDRGVCDTPLRSPSKTLGAIVRGFKSAVTKQIGFPIWQRNYYEHIIRNAHAFERISNYIRNNPAQWNKDMFKYK